MKTFVADIEALLYEDSPVGLAHQLERRRGIESVRVDAVASTIAITFEENRMTRRGVGLLIAQCGYQCARVQLSAGH